METQIQRNCLQYTDNQRRSIIDIIHNANELHQALLSLYKMEEPKDPYNVLNYDQVFILLKDGIGREQYQGYVKLDRTRNKYFLSGRFVKQKNFNTSSVRLLPEKNYKAYKDTKRAIDQEKLTVNVFFSHIDFITLPFDNFDWKK